MKKSIKISDYTYDELVKLMQPRETFDDVIRRLIGAVKTIQGAKVSVSSTFKGEV